MFLGCGNAPVFAVSSVLKLSFAEAAK
jgi:hypothetical protein